MSEDGLPAASAQRRGRPLWWWSLLHGGAVCLWGLFAILTPATGLADWRPDGIAFGIDLVAVGAILVLQGRLGRGPAEGRWPFVAGGSIMLAAAAACLVLGALDLPIWILWTIFGYLVVDGLVLTLGSLRHPVYRFWGALGGAPMFVAALGIVLAWFLSPGYGVMDVVFGVFGVFYGITVVTASLLARYGELRGSPVV